MKLPPFFCLLLHLVHSIFVLAHVIDDAGQNWVGNFHELVVDDVLPARPILEKFVPQFRRTLSGVYCFHQGPFEFRAQLQRYHWRLFSPLRGGEYLRRAVDGEYLRRAIVVRRR